MGERVVRVDVKLKQMKVRIGVALQLNPKPTVGSKMTTGTACREHCNRKSVTSRTVKPGGRTPAEVDSEP